MKLLSRTSLVALGTTTAVALSGMTVPTASADTDSSPDYAARYAKVHSEYKITSARYTKIKATFDEAGAKYKSLKTDNSYRKAGNDLYLADQYLIGANKSMSDLATTGDRDSDDYGRMKTILDNLSDAGNKLTSAQTELDTAMPLECDGDDDSDTDNSGSMGIDFGSLVSSFGSSGQMKITKDGKQRCVSRIDYYADKLKSIVSILTVVFTVITTVTKIGDTLQRQMQGKH